MADDVKATAKAGRADSVRQSARDAARVILADPRNTKAANKAVGRSVLTSTNTSPEAVGTVVLRSEKVEGVIRRLKASKNHEIPFIRSIQKDFEEKRDKESVRPRVKAGPRPGLDMFFTEKDVIHPEEDDPKK